MEKPLTIEERIRLKKSYFPVPKTLDEVMEYYAKRDNRKTKTRRGGGIGIR